MPLLAILFSFAETLVEVLSVFIAAHALLTEYSKKRTEFTSWRTNFARGLPLLFDAVLKALWDGAIRQFSLVNLGGGLLVALLLFVPRLYRELATSGLLNHHSVQFVITTAVLLIGISAFWIKREWQMQYGIGEIIFGVATAYHTAAGLALKDAMLARWTALIAAVYVVSRGMSNIMAARESLNNSLDALDTSSALLAPERP